MKRWPIRVLPTGILGMGWTGHARRAETEAVTDEA